MEAWAQDLASALDESSHFHVKAKLSKLGRINIKVSHNSRRLKSAGNLVGKVFLLFIEKFKTTYVLCFGLFSFRQRTSWTRAAVKGKCMNSMRMYLPVFSRCAFFLFLLCSIAVSNCMHLFLPVY